MKNLESAIVDMIDEVQSRDASARSASSGRPKPMATRREPTIQTAGKVISLAEASAGLDALMERAANLARTDLAGFKKLPKREQNDFLAQARGEQRVGMPSDRENRTVHPRQLVRSPFNRTRFDEEKLVKLVKSVKEHGIIQPVVVRQWNPETIVGKIELEEAQKRGEEMWEIVAGERRWQAATMAEILVPVIIRQLSDEAAIELQAIENLEREDLNPLDEATKYQQLRDIYMRNGMEKEAAIERICEKLKRGRSTVYNTLRLVELPETVQESVREGRLPKSHAELLIKVSDPKEVEKLTRKITCAENGQWRAEPLPFRETKELVSAAVQREKNLAAWQKEKEEFEEKGWAVMGLANCEKYLGGSRDYWYVKGSAECGFVKDDTTCQLPGAQYRTYKQLWKKAPEPMLGRLPDGTPAHVYVEMAADLAVKAGGKLKVGENGRAVNKSDSEIQREREHEQRKTVFARAVDQVLVFEVQKEESTAFWSNFVQMLARALSNDAWKKLAKRRKWKEASRGEIRPHMGDLKCAELRALAVEMLMLHNYAPSTWSTKWSPDFEAACELRKVDLAAIATEVQTSGWKGKGSK